jgi:hypothetical protein
MQSNTEMQSPLKMIEKAMAQHQEQQQQYGAIVGTFLDHRPSVIQRCFFMYQRHVKAFHETAKTAPIGNRSQHKDNKHLRRTFQESFDKMLRTLHDLTQASMGIHRHNEKVQGVLTSLLEKIQKPPVEKEKPKEKEKEKEKPNYRAVLANKDAKA